MIVNEEFCKRSEKGIQNRMFRQLRMHAHTSGYKDKDHPYYEY